MSTTMAVKRHGCRTSRLITLFILLIAIISTSGLSVNNAVSFEKPKIAPELSMERIELVSSLVAAAMGDSKVQDKAERYASARSFSSNVSAPQKELVYGELSIPVLATLLDAVGVEQGDCFLDIGSGDGGLVLGAGLLYPDYIQKCRGLEVVPGLVERSKLHAERLMASNEDTTTDCNQHVNAEFLLGNVHEACRDTSIESMLQKTTLAVCFATTWSAGNIQESKRTSLQRRLLPKLSKALTRLPVGARIIMVDARLDCKDGYSWEGDLKIHCPDTAPFSIASLYRRIE